MKYTRRYSYAKFGTFFLGHPVYVPKVMIYETWLAVVKVVDHHRHHHHHHHLIFKHMEQTNEYKQRQAQRGRI